MAKRPTAHRRKQARPKRGRAAQRTPTTTTRASSPRRPSAARTRVTANAKASKEKRGAKRASHAAEGRRLSVRAKRRLRTPPPLQGEERATREDQVPTPPSSLDLDRRASAARSGRREMREQMREHTETGPAFTGGDPDANWEVAYSSGDEAPGGDNPTPDQDVVDELGRAIGVEYQDQEELKGADKIVARDRHRWELDPASSEDYTDRVKRRRR